MLGPMLMGVTRLVWMGWKMIVSRRKVENLMNVMNRKKRTKMVTFSLMPNLAKKMESTRMAKRVRMAKKAKGKKVMRARVRRVCEENEGRDMMGTRKENVGFMIDLCGSGEVVAGTATVKGEFYEWGEIVG